MPTFVRLAREDGTTPIKASGGIGLSIDAE